MMSGRLPDNRAGQVGSSTDLSGYPTYRDLADLRVAALRIQPSIDKKRA